jgi:hypothetical protein
MPLEQMRGLMIAITVIKIMMMVALMMEDEGAIYKSSKYLIIYKSSKYLIIYK